MNTDNALENKENRKLYGRRFGRPLKAGRVDVLDALLPALHVPKDAVGRGKSLSLDALFPTTPDRLYFEVGFGNGEHLAGLLAQDKDAHFIGAEPFVNGMSAFLKSIADEKAFHDRVRVWMDNALDLMDSLPGQCLDGIYVLNPDPWPKARHVKRRIISQKNLDIFARLMKPGATLYMTTDVDELAEWMAGEACAHPEFEWMAQRADDWRTQPANWIETRYEQKGRAAGRVQSYLIFRRK